MLFMFAHTTTKPTRWINSQTPGNLIVSRQQAIKVNTAKAKHLAGTNAPPSITIQQWLLLPGGATTQPLDCDGVKTNCYLII